MKQRQEKIACLTAYDASFARLIDAQGAEVILVGDSLGMVIQGHATTLPVCVSDMVYHTKAVCRATTRAMVVADMPFMSYATPHQALRNAARLLSHGGAQMVKVEGGAWLEDTVRTLDERGIAVCGHLGLTPQSVHNLGGYRVQGRSPDEATRILEDSHALEAAGIKLLVLECVPRLLAAQVTRALRIPVIGIGAGADCDGQVLVIYDLLGLNPKQPRFSADFLESGGSIAGAVGAYVQAVKTGAFPQPMHGFD